MRVLSIVHVVFSSRIAGGEHHCVDLANAQAAQASTPLGALARNLFSLHAQADAEHEGLDFSSIQKLYRGKD